jgi:hypothetical protein
MKSLRGILAVVVHTIGMCVLGYLMRCVGETVCNIEPAILSWIVLAVSIVLAKLSFVIVSCISMILYQGITMKLLYKTESFWRWIALMLGLLVVFYNTYELWLTDISKYSLWSVIVGAYLSWLYCGRLYVSYLSFKTYMNLFKKE